MNNKEIIYPILDVLMLFLSGYDRKEIAFELRKDVKTIDYHMARLRTHFNARTNEQLLMVLYTYEFIKPINPNETKRTKKRK